VPSILLLFAILQVGITLVNFILHSSGKKIVAFFLQSEIWVFSLLQNEILIISGKKIVAFFLQSEIRIVSGKRIVAFFLQSKIRIIFGKIIVAFFLQSKIRIGFAWILQNNSQCLEKHLVLVQNSAEIFHTGALASRPE